jgi:hypothetical protein
MRTNEYSIMLVVGIVIAVLAWKRYNNRSLNWDCDECEEEFLTFYFYVKYMNKNGKPIICQNCNERHEATSKPGEETQIKNEPQEKPKNKSEKAESGKRIDEKGKNESRQKKNEVLLQQQEQETTIKYCTQC